MSKILHCLIFSGFLMVITSTTRADQLPSYDVEKMCEMTAAFGGSFSHTVYNTCIEIEQDAYNSLKNVWENIPKHIQKQCNEIASFGGSESYSTLETCIEIEVEAALERKTFRR